jgi:4-hydroxy-tetrahydrodipicolinate reductase
MIIGIVGNSGRIGSLIYKKLSSINNHEIICFNSSNSISEMDEFCNKSDLIIDFSHSSILPNLLKYAQIHNTKLVIGTTGLTSEDFENMKNTSKYIPILYSSNMSFGANIISIVANIIATMTKNHHYDIEIIEKHHKNKKDAPSGTAIMLSDSIKSEYDAHINIHSIRGGDIFGEHEIMFLGNDDNITITHQALNRDIFANGAIHAAFWLTDKLPSLYSMKDILLDL